MAYSVPTTRATGYVVTAANWNSDVVDNATWLGRDAPHARVYNSANLSITTATLTALTFNSERYDTGACHSTVSNTGRLTVPAGGGGVYDIKANIRFAANATGTRKALLRLNGATYIAGNEGPGNASIDNDVTVATDYLLAAADYVEVIVWQNSGGALNVLATGNLSPEFMWEWRKVS